MLLCRPVCDTHTMLSQIIASYLKPFYSNNEYIIQNSQDFPKIQSERHSFKSNEEYFSGNVESLFNKVLVN